MCTGAQAIEKDVPSFPFLIRTEYGMFIKAYCLITVESGRSLDVVHAIIDKNHPRVIKVHAVAGTYDVVAELEGDDPREIGEAIIGAIQKIDGVVSTVTLLAFSSEFIERIENARAGILPDYCPVGMDTGSAQ